MSDFTYLADYDRPSTIQRIQRDRQKLQDIARENVKHYLKLIANDTENAVDTCRDLMRSGADVSEELKQLDQIGHGLALVAGLLKLEAERSQ